MIVVLTAIDPVVLVVVPMMFLVIVAFVVGVVRSRDDAART